MSDLGLFALGMLFGALAPAVGLYAGPVVLLASAILSGVSDGKRHRRLRWVWSWAPALLGSFVVPVLVMLILKEQFFGPRAGDGGLTLLVVLAFLSAYAAAFVAVTLAASVLTRRKRHPSDYPTISEVFGGPDEA